MRERKFWVPRAAERATSSKPISIEAMSELQHRKLHAKIDPLTSAVESLKTHVDQELQAVQTRTTMVEETVTQVSASVSTLSTDFEQLKSETTLKAQKLEGLISSMNMSAASSRSSTALVGGLQSASSVTAATTLVKEISPNQLSRGSLISTTKASLMSHSTA